MQCWRLTVFCPEAWESSEGDCRSYTNCTIYSWFRQQRDSGSGYDTVSRLVENFVRPGNNNLRKWQELYEREDLMTSRISATSFYYACLIGLIPAMDILYINEELGIGCFSGIHPFTFSGNHLALSDRAEEQSHKLVSTRKTQWGSQERTQ